MGPDLLGLVGDAAAAKASAEAGALIAPTFNPSLEHALSDKMARIAATGGAFGMLEALAIVLGMVQNSLVPSLPRASLALVVADHGFALADGSAMQAPSASVDAVRQERLPLVALASQHEVTLHVIYASGSEPVAARAEPTLQRVRATADARADAAMTAEQANAALRQGVRESERIGGGAIVCAALGAGSDVGAALALGALAQRDPADFAAGSGDAAAVVSAVRERHAALWKSAAARDPLEVLAALGGFETATLAGLMLGAAARRRLVLVDGLAALAALQVATRIAPYVADYCVPVRSHARRGLVAALDLCRPAMPAPLEIDAMDGTGGVLAVPILRSAAALLATRTG